MIKLLLITFLASAVAQLPNLNEDEVLTWYFCIEKEGNSTYVPMVYTRNDAIICMSLNSNCFCAGLSNRCLLGPDRAANFAIEDVPVQVSNTCEKDFCLCTNHNDFVGRLDARYNQMPDKFD